MKQKPVTGLEMLKKAPCSPHMSFRGFSPAGRCEVLSTPLERPFQPCRRIQGEQHPRGWKSIRVFRAPRLGSGIVRKEIAQVHTQTVVIVLGTPPATAKGSPAPAMHRPLWYVGNRIWNTTVLTREEFDDGDVGWKRVNVQI